MLQCVCLYVTEKQLRKDRITSQSWKISEAMLSFIWQKFMVCSCFSDKKPHFCSIVLISLRGIFCTVVRIYWATVSSMTKPPGKLKRERRSEPRHRQAPVVKVYKAVPNTTSRTLASALGAVLSAFGGHQQQQVKQLPRVTFPHILRRLPCWCLLWASGEGWGAGTHPLLPVRNSPGSPHRHEETSRTDGSTTAPPPPHTTADEAAALQATGRREPANRRAPPTFRSSQSDCTWWPSGPMTRQLISCPAPWRAGAVRAVCPSARCGELVSAWLCPWQPCLGLALRGGRVCGGAWVRSSSDDWSKCEGGWEGGFGLTRAGSVVPFEA